MPPPAPRGGADEGVGSSRAAFSTVTARSTMALGEVDDGVEVGAAALGGVELEEDLLGCLGDGLVAEAGLENGPSRQTSKAWSKAA